MQKLKVLDLFSGIGGFSLGLERTGGFETVAFCEIDPYCRAVLRKHWPHVPQFEDVTKLNGSEVGPVDVICGGFPCQDISNAGKRAGIDGERSGLWSEYARIIGEVRPSYVIVENVAALLGRGLDRVLGDLAALGFDAEWHCIPAGAVGAPHQRDRLWIIAYPGGQQHEGSRYAFRWSAAEGLHQTVLADTKGWEAGPSNDLCWRQPDSGTSGSLPHSAHYTALCEGVRRGDAAGQWWAEPDVGRVAHGVPSRVDRLKSLGNAVVPQIPEIIGRAILQSQHT